MLAIRPYHPSDAPYLMDICLKTAFHGQDASHLLSDPFLIGQLYVAPYLHYDPELCLVLTQADKPVGYVLATADSARFERQCETEFFKPLRARYPKPKVMDDSYQHRVFNRLHLGHPTPAGLSDYPAHLHIDLLPEAQGQGMGKQLMVQLFDCMAKQGIAGVHLIVSEQNEGALAFYQRIGLENLGQQAGGIVFVKSFQ